MQCFSNKQCEFEKLFLFLYSELCVERTWKTKNVREFWKESRQSSERTVTLSKTPKLIYALGTTYRIGDESGTIYSKYLDMNILSIAKSMEEFIKRPYREGYINYNEAAEKAMEEYPLQIQMKYNALEKVFKRHSWELKNNFQCYCKHCKVFIIVYILYKYI